MIDRTLGRIAAAAVARRLSPISRKVRRDRLTYLSPLKLRGIERACQTIERQGIDGDVVEFGVALGGSTIVLATLTRAPRRVVGFDLFGMIPPPGERDGADAHERFAAIRDGQSKGIGGDPYYGYRPDLLAQVKGSLIAHGLPVEGGRVRLVPGLFEDTVARDAPAVIALAHIDCDWFDPVALCLRETWKRLPVGGIVILDDYHDYSGCRDATDAFLRATPDAEIVARRSHLVLRRKAPLPEAAEASLQTA